jgi:hypothetical protein
MIVCGQLMYEMLRSYNFDRHDWTRYSLIMDNMLPVLKTCNFPQLNIGKYIFNDTEVSIVDSEPDPKFPPGSEGILGIKILKKFNIILDYINKCLYLRPNMTYSK